MKEGLIKDAYELIAREVQLILSLSYLLMIGIGMLFNHHKYAEFGIDIFDYADVFDFLIAPFADWRIVAFALLFLLVPVSLALLDKVWREKAPKFYSRINFNWDKKPWYNTFRIISFAGLFIYYTFLAAEMYGKKSKDRVLLQEDIHIIFADDQCVSGKQIGKTNDILFLLKDEQVTVIPLTSLVKEIEL